MIQKGCDLQIAVFLYTFVILVKPPFNHHSTTAPPRHPHRNNDAILLPREHRNNDAILLARHIATTPPSYATPNIIPHIIKLATTPSHQTTTHNERFRVDTTSTGWMEKTAWFPAKNPYGGCKAGQAESPSGTAVGTPPLSR